MHKINCQIVNCCLNTTMNNYFTKLSLDIPVFNQEPDLDILVSKYQNNFTHYVVNQLDLHQELFRLFDQLNLIIDSAEVFYIPKFYQLPIHNDGGNYCDFFKINWIYFGLQSCMQWFEVKGEPQVVRHNAGFDINTYKLDQSNLIYSAQLTGPNLLQVGVPHNVVTQYQERLCLSIVPKQKNPNKLLTYQEGLSIFSNYISGADGED